LLAHSIAAQQINCSQQDNHSLYCIYLDPDATPKIRSSQQQHHRPVDIHQELAESAVASPVRSWPNKSLVAGSRKGAAALLSTNRNTDALSQEGSRHQIIGSYSVHTSYFGMRCAKSLDRSGCSAF